VAERLFSERERDDAPHVEGLAARFAAKEATWKALGVGLGATGFRDVEVQRTSSGAPTLVLRGRAAELARQQGVARWHVSLTHTATTAAAVVMAS
jgi:holo-[acyl-carrier protein] synthase